jgi:hypothetical protein
MNESYSPGRYYQMGWNDRYSGKDRPMVKPAGWSDTLFWEYQSGFNDCNNKIVSEAKEAVIKNSMNEGKHFIQE